MTTSQADEKTLNALNVLRIFFPVFLGVSLLVVASDLYNYFRKSGWIAKRKHTPLDEQYFKLRVLLTIGSVFSSINFTLLAAYVFGVPFDDSSRACDAIVRIFCITYSTAYWSVLAFLVYRIECLKGLVKCPMYRRILLVVKAVVVLFVPFVTYPMAMVSMEGAVTAGGVCVLLSTETWPPLVFIITTCIFSVLVLYLFLSPLHASLAMLNSVNAARLKRVMLRNMFLTLFSLFSSIVALITFIWLNFQGEVVFQLLSVLPPVLEVFLLGGCTRLMILEENHVDSMRRTAAGVALNAGVSFGWFKSTPKQLPPRSDETRSLPDAPPVVVALVAV